MCEREKKEKRAKRRVTYKRQRNERRSQTARRNLPTLNLNHGKLLHTVVADHHQPLYPSSRCVDSQRQNLQWNCRGEYHSHSSWFRKFCSIE